MRNWNYDRRFWWVSKILIHILPMRNWNFWNWEWILACLCYSHPTYEELKLLPSQTELKSESNSHPTYEELKRTLICLEIKRLHEFTSYLWGIETACGRMRRWGIPWFTSYLWGIETRRFLWNNMRMLKIHILPMRNWNGLWPYEKVRNTLIHILPMRNWNVNPFSPNASPTKIHILPMRNWNK